MTVSCNSYFHESLGGTESNSLKKMESTGKPVRIIPFSGIGKPVWKPGKPVSMEIFPRFHWILTLTVRLTG